MSAPAGALSLRGVTKRYGDALALDAIDLDVPAGSRAAVVGPSGSGKTTLLRLIAGFEAPDAGQVTLDGVVLADGPRAVPAHRRGVGVVMQDGALFPHLSVGDNIGFGLDKATPDRAARIATLMQHVELDPAMLARRPDALSGGQQQRVALARALARSPRLMLLDEPFSSLDTALRAGTRRTVTNILAAAGITAILVTHDQAEAMSFADHVAVLGGGRLLQAGPPRELYARPADRVVATLLGDAIILRARITAGRADCALGILDTDGAPGDGEADLMLRPEQVLLTALRSGEDASPGTTLGEVTALEFAGGTCTVALRLSSGIALNLAQRRYDMPEVGTWMRVAVSGRAHVFA